MKFRAFFALAALLAATSASAQNLQVIRPVQLAQPPASQQLEVNTPEAQIARLEKDNARLREENAQLRAENAALSGRVNNFSSLGGSEVHAYCPNRQTSRNTAGAESDCGAAGGYTCEPVSGLCRTSCQTSDMCAGGWTCDTGAQRCVNTSGR
jgi:hypothetical protein